LYGTNRQNEDSTTTTSTFFSSRTTFSSSEVLMPTPFWERSWTTMTWSPAWLSLGARLKCCTEMPRLVSTMSFLGPRPM